MALVIKKLYHGYFWIFDNLADPRAKDIFICDPLNIVPILGLYYYFVLSLGPKLMEKRKPFKLRKLIIAYNISQIIINASLLVLATKAIYNMDWNCALLDYSDSPKSKLEFRLAASFYLLKLYDLVDTVFFVLRKSTRQINFLHVYHHGGMVFGSCIAVNFTGGGELLWTGYINGIIHTVMFTYYLLTAIDTKWKENLRFKKFLTQIQLVQFVLNILIYGRLFFKPDCAFPRVIPMVYLPQNVFMLILFGDFYLRNYVLKNKKNVTKQS